ncbi:hypothetical protein PM082_015281 [Marasmius tenuissimus]|nr:hypothetical protein PM082_015281 [Marasmius tenuissimus]
MAPLTNPPTTTNLLNITTRWTLILLTLTLLSITAIGVPPLVDQPSSILHVQDKPCSSPFPSGFSLQRHSSSESSIIMERLAWLRATRTQFIVTESNDMAQMLRASSLIDSWV